MSTAAGQKYLNENLHRGALLSSHLTPRLNQGHTVGPEGISTIPSGCNNYIYDLYLQNNIFIKLEISKIIGSCKCFIFVLYE